MVSSWGNSGIDDVKRREITRNDLRMVLMASTCLDRALVNAVLLRTGKAITTLRSRPRLARCLVSRRPVESPGVGVPHHPCRHLYIATGSSWPAVACDAEAAPTIGSEPGPAYILSELTSGGSIAKSSTAVIVRPLVSYL